MIKTHPCRTRNTGLGTANLCSDFSRLYDYNFIRFQIIPVCYQYATNMLPVCYMLNLRIVSAIQRGQTSSRNKNAYSFGALASFLPVSDNKSYTFS